MKKGTEGARHFLNHSLRSRSGLGSSPNQKCWLML